jgi:hypothetical protein
MSNAEKTLHPDEKFKAGKLAGSISKAGLGLAGVFGIASLLLGNAKGDHWRRFFYSYVTAWSFVLSIAIGALFFVMLHHLVKARWSTVVRRLAECVASTFPVIFVAGLGIVLPMLAGYGDLYYWAHHDAHNHEINHHLVSKLSWWLNPSYFTVRYVLYFAIYIGLARYFVKTSRAQDESGDVALTTRMRMLSAPLMIVFSFTTVFIAFDVLMSLAPKWYSTIFGVNFFGGANIAFFATLILLSLVVQRSGRLTRSITTEHYHDLGKWLFAWTFFWAYTAFSQFMLIWYASIPEETVFYKYRMFSEWQWVSIAALVGHFAFPFVFLLSRWTKRILPSLTFFAVWQLVFHWVDLYWNVMPNVNWGSTHVQAAGGETIKLLTGPLMGDAAQHTVGFSPVDVTLWLAMIGVFLLALGRSMTGNLIPVKDPQLPSSLSFENY